MNIRHLILVAVATLVLTACGQNSEPSGAGASSPAAQVAFAQGTIKKGDQAVCVVCATNEGSTAAEAVAETIDYQGRPAPSATRPRRPSSSPAPPDTRPNDILLWH